VSASRAVEVPPPPLVWRLIRRHVLPERRERFRLTFAGWVLAVVAAGLGWAAYSNSSNILFLALSLTLAMAVLGGVLAAVNFRKLSWEVIPPSSARAGEIAPVRIVLRNGRRRLPAWSIRFHTACRRQRLEGTVRFADAVRAGTTAERFWEFVPAARGRCDLAVSGATSSYPFALFEKTMRRDTRLALLVRPARTAYRLEADGGRLIRPEGDRHRKGAGAELVGLRDYREGDPVRLIHWKVSARRGRPIVRETAEPGEPGWSLRLDPSDFYGASDAVFEKACSLAGTLAEDLFHKERLVALATGDEAFSPVKRPADVHAFLDRLAALTRPVVPVRPGVRRADTLHLVPGPGETVHVRHRDDTVGEA